MRTISSPPDKEFRESFIKDYSKFKHGSKTIARQFGKDIAEICDFPADSKLIFYSAPHNNIHTASNAFKDYLLSYCADQFLTKNISVRQGKIDRKYSYDNDYGMMSAEQRRAAISSDIFHIDKHFIEPDDVLVFVDDIKITGSHENRIIELLEREQIKNEVIFIYIAVYTGNDPTIENVLNHKYISTLRDINDIIRNDEFIFNTRVAKFILKSDIESFVSFITYQSQTFKETLYALSVLNGYHTNDQYKINFGLLKNLI